ncbi:DNA-directed DNA polymerase, partial [Chytriomyces confervae]
DLNNDDNDNDDDATSCVSETLSDFSDIISDDEENQLSDVEQTPDEIHISEETQHELNTWNIKAVLISKSKPTQARKLTHVKDHRSPNLYPSPMDTPPSGSISVKDIPPAPTTRKQMMVHPYKDYFIGAEQTELNAMHAKGRDKQTQSFMLVYVDDLIIMALTKGEVEQIKTQLKQSFSIKDMGIAGDTSSPAPTPMVVNWEHDNDSPKLTPEKEKQYHSVVMKLSYLATQTRPDLSFTVNTLAQHQLDCREHDWKALLRALRYLKGTHDLGLYYRPECNPIATLHTSDKDFLDDFKWFYPHAHADASYAQEAGRKSRSGHVFLMAGAAVTWYCKKQPVVALSSTEAEYYSLSEAVKEALWIRQMLREVDFPLNDATVVHQDNLSTMAIALNPIQHQRVKHMDVKVHFLRDHLDKEDVTMVHCPTEDMVADMLTKALPPLPHRKFTNLIGLRSLADLQGTSNSSFANDRHF